ncbi:MAG: hypothetical protein ACI841_002092, partial [Planctomycetota bacterium]
PPPPPTNDDCTTPIALSGTGIYAVDTTTATTGLEGQLESNCYAFGTTAVNLDLWYEWTADFTGICLATTCGSSIDTKIAAWPNGGCPVDGTSLACNDDACGLQSTINFPVSNGSTYLLQMGNFSAAGGGAYSLDIGEQPAAPVNDSCASAIAISGSGSYATDNTWASTGTEGQNESSCYFFGSTTVDNDVWYEWTADFTGLALAATCGSAVDTKLAAYPSGGCPVDGSSLACNDDACGLQSELLWNVTNGSTYLIQAGTFPGAQGGVFNLDLGVAPPPPANNDCSTPTGINAQGSFAFDTFNATTGTEGQNESNCYKFGTSAVNNDVWYDWTADATGIATVTMCLSGVVSDTKIAAYPGGGCPADGTSLNCNDDTCGLQSEITFPVAAGASYMLQIGHFSAATEDTGSFDISIAGSPGIGTNYCTAAANSVNAGGSNISATGSVSVIADNLRLIADNAPNQPAIFYHGPNQISLTFGNGFRCVGGTVVRMPVVVGSGGTFEYQIDMVGNGLAAGVHNFQCWYRDPAGAGQFFNLSDGLEIILIP